MSKVTRRGILGLGAAATSARMLPTVSQAESKTATHPGKQKVHSSLYTISPTRTLI